MGKMWKRVPPFLSKNILQGSLVIKLCQNLVATLLETIVFKETQISAVFIGPITDAWSFHLTSLTIITKLTSRQVIQLVDERLLLDGDDRTLVEVASQPVNFIARANLPRIIFNISHSEDVLVSRKGNLSFCVSLRLDIYKNVILLALHVI